PSGSRTSTSVRAETSYLRATGWSPRAPRACSTAIRFCWPTPMGGAAGHPDAVLRRAPSLAAVGGRGLHPAAARGRAASLAALGERPALPAAGRGRRPSRGGVRRVAFLATMRGSRLPRVPQPCLAPAPTALPQVPPRALPEKLARPAPLAWGSRRGREFRCPARPLTVRPTARPSPGTRCSKRWA
ncbi:MAG: hypothetical protein OXG72_17270, partial [Acidobacteria bacterium]|nr:hypothetical protein [Acidobacteriota bacterium]